jgi:hypothetical protein
MSLLYEFFGCFDRRLESLLEARYSINQRGRLVTDIDIIIAAIFSWLLLRRLRRNEDD